MTKSTGYFNPPIFYKGTASKGDKSIDYAARKLTSNNSSKDNKYSGFVGISQSNSDRSSQGNEYSDFLGGSRSQR